ncbi:MAG: cation-translocating P-type ATPase [Candidatus Promineifilaceae bacterium]|nr:cation-translocating P-type ATPase [Candidatus Promineifilaceae bacterium]
MSSFYQLDADAVVAQVGSDRERGLASEQAQERLRQDGPNELIDRGTKPPWAIVWDQMTDIMVVILIIAAVVSVGLGEWEDALVITAIVILNAILGFSQEYRAEQAIAALKKLAVPTVRVRRDNQVQEVSARELVVGDVVLLEAGNKVPADGRLVECVNLRVQEAALTGESEPVEKTDEALGVSDVPLGDRHNMVYMGTVVSYGRAKAVVTATGMNTELGSIAEMLQTVEREQTPLQRRLDQLGKTLAVATLVIIGIVFALGLLRGEPFELMLLTGISMAVAAVPEGLPAVVTITLALGSRRMLRRNALIRKLPAVETLGSVTVICSDKTGTLTENRMAVTMLDVIDETVALEALTEQSEPVSDAELDRAVGPSRRSLALLMKAATLCNDAILQPRRVGSGDWRSMGDPTEGAIIVAAAQLGLDKERLEKRWPRVAEVSFTSERKRMTTVHKTDDLADDGRALWREAPYVAFSKGAVDSLLEISRHVWVDDGAIPLQDELLARIGAANERLARQGQRVLGVAFRPLHQPPQALTEDELEQELIFVGLIGMSDPPRAEVEQAVLTSRTAGIRPIMITGDHPLTAQHIAGVLDISRNGRVLTGRDLTGMSSELLRDEVAEVPVFARVSPEHKLNIVEALQDRGEVVAMTGDGVNDAPALKKADIGVAMGVTGTDVSKEAADMVLLDDNFATIVAAVEEGRVIYDNIRKFIKYILSSNTGEIWVMLVAPFLGMPLPLLPLQILWINLVTDGLPGLALAVEPAERNTMTRRPYHPGESVFSRGIGRQILWIGGLMGLVSLLVGYLGWLDNPGGAWQTMVFTTLTLAQMGNALAIRSSRDSLFTIGLRSNLLMLGAVLLTFLLQLMVIYVPLLQRFFETEALSIGQLAVSLVASTTVFWAAELEKWWLRRSRTGGSTQRQ